MGLIALKDGSDSMDPREGCHYNQDKEPLFILNKERTLRVWKELREKKNDIIKVRS